ncbi:MAG: excinuclease ABC subunit UvrC [Acidobacteria bacterium]|nr:MAG: excinuclease ABC subunit UvrC [Acidobacteriota bacterium]
MDLSSKSRVLPTQPGVYLFKNAAGGIIYVGKAKDLRARVRTYFLAGSQENAKTGSLVREAADFETIVVDTEAEALALENTLIKQHQPRFNVLLRDDKTYPYIKLSQEVFPRVSVTRRVVRDGSEYFGPYFPAGLAYRLLHFIQKYFQLCSCRRDLSRPHARPCFQYQLHRCLGPCMPGLVTQERYQQAARDTRLFLSGRQPELARDLRQRRDAAAAGERFEEAAGYRDLLTVLEDIQERQKMHAVEGQDADVVGLYREGARAALHVFPMRHGRVVDRREFFWEALPDEEASDAELLGALLKQIYLEQPYLPPRIDAPMDFEDRAALEATLTAQRGSRVEIALPQRGAKKEMLELAERNARLSFARRFRAPAAEQQAEEQWAALGRALEVELSAGARRVECFDISHFQGAETVASMVVWAAGKMRRGEYRRYRIREVAGVDDFRSMAEVVRRRYRRRLAEGGELPGLILIDGGIGQLHAAQAVLTELGLEQVPLASLAKREELVFVPGREAEPVRLDHHSNELHLLQMIRDEAHRFAITFHRERRGKANVRSELLAVPGIGPATTRKLLRHFGSVSGVRAADAAALAEVMPEARAQTVWNHLHLEQQEPTEILKN